MGALVLVATIAAATALAHALVRWVRAPAPRRVAVVVSAALLAVVPGTICRATGNLEVAMALAALVFAAGAGALALRKRADPGVTAGAAAPVAMPAWPAVAIGVVLVALVAHGAVTRNFFDEEAHIPFALVIARGIVPPEHPLAMGQVVPYHWGVDALYAQLIVAGLRPDHAIDVVTVASMVLLLLAASALGGALMGRAGATFATILAPLAGSPLALPLHEQLGPFQVAPTMYPKDWTLWNTRPPPLTADFFQHPQGLAFPIVLVVLLLASAGERRLRWLGVFVLCLLSLVQSVHFLVMGFGLLVATGVSAWRAPASARERLRGAWPDAAALFLALVGAVLLGGFFSPKAGTAQALAWGRQFFTDTNPWMSMLHHIVAFGLPLVLLPALVVWRPLRALPERTRVTIAAGAALAFALPNVVVYTRTWDIVKLYSAAGFLAGLGLALVLAAAWQQWLSMWSRTAIVMATALTIAFPAIWLMSRTILQGQLGIPVKVDWRLRDGVTEMAAPLRRALPARAKVLVGDAEIARMTGVFAPGFDGRRYHLDGHLLDLRGEIERVSTRLSALKHLGPRELQALDVEYALLLPVDEARLSEIGRERLADFERVALSLPRHAVLYRLPSRPR